MTLSLRYPLVFWSIALLPHVFFLLHIFRFCKQRHMPALPWMGASMVVPFIAIPSLYARQQDEATQQKTFWRLFVTALLLELTFFFVAFVVDVA